MLNPKPCWQEDDDATAYEDIDPLPEPSGVHSHAASSRKADADSQWAGLEVRLPVSCSHSSAPPGGPAPFNANNGRNSS